MALNKSYVLLIEELVPDYIREEYPTYIEFLKEFFNTWEEESGPLNVLQNLIKVIDIKETDDEDLERAISQYLSSFPIEYLNELDIREFIVNSKSFYSEKGNETSARFIFNLLGSSIEFYYPSSDIFLCNMSELSGSHSIHDNRYYAYYTYEIISDIDLVKYKELFFNTMHPAGMKIFSKKLIDLDTDGTGIPLDNTLDVVERKHNLIIQTLINVRNKSGVTSFSGDVLSDDLVLSGTFDVIFKHDRSFNTMGYPSNSFYKYYLENIGDSFGYVVGDFVDLRGEMFIDGKYPSTDVFPSDSFIPIVDDYSNTMVRTQRSAYQEILAYP